MSQIKNMDQERLQALLQRIADALGVPTGVFSDRNASAEVSLRMVAAQEVAELLEAFALITDEQERRNCIEFIRRRGTRV